MTRPARYGAVAGLAVLQLCATEHHGQVNLGALPIPGATVTVAQKDKTLSTITDPQGAYSFPDLADGAWTIEVEMRGFAVLRQEVSVAPDAAASEWNLK